MSMKLTKKDKIMLLVLAVVGFVALFYMFGIRPLKQEAAELTPQIEQISADLATKQTANQGTLAEINQNKALIEQVLDKYYSIDDKPLLHEEIADRVIFERMMKDICDNLAIGEYPTLPFKPTKVETVFTENGVSVVTSYKMWEVPLNFIVDDLSELNSIVEYFRADKDFVLVGYKWAEKRDEIVDGESTTTKIQYLCSIQVNFYMRDDTSIGGSDVEMPKPLADVNAARVDGELNRVTFDKVENAVKYKAFSVAIDDMGNRVFTPIENVNFSEDQLTGKMIADIQVDGKQLVCIQAVGDMTTTYKSLLNKATPIIEIGA